MSRATGSGQRQELSDRNPALGTQTPKQRHIQQETVHRRYEGKGDGCPGSFQQQHGEGGERQPIVGGSLGDT